MWYWLVGYTVAVCVCVCDIDWDQIGRFDNERSSAYWNPLSSTPSALNTEALSLFASPALIPHPFISFVHPIPLSFSHTDFPCPFTLLHISSSHRNPYLPVNAHVCIEGGNVLDLLRLILLKVFGIILSAERRGRKTSIRSHKINRETDFWWACVHAAPPFVNVCVWARTRVYMWTVQDHLKGVESPLGLVQTKLSSADS